MSVIRQQFWYGQQRADAAHLRAIESGVAGDFDVLAGKIIGGTSPLVVKGFQVLTTNAVGSPATSLQISTAGSLLIHYLASESGSIFSVPTDRAVETLSSSNTRVIGSFTANTTNYVGIDLRRSLDSSTADIVQFINTISQAEIAQRVALARTLDYVFVISTADFSALSGVCPIAKIATDVNNAVTTITDARNVFGRLGSGGTIPNAQHAYAWPGGRVLETASDFNYGDRSISSLKTWMDAAMTRMWEIGGGTNWYSPTADRNVKLVRTGSPLITGDWFFWDGTNLTWQGLVYVFDNSPGYYNVIQDQTIASPGLTDLAAGECVYVDIDRSQNHNGGAPIVAHKAALTTLGTPTVPGSRFVLAWRNTDGTVIARDAGTTLPIASTTVLGITRISHNTAGTYIVTPMSDPSPVAISEGGRDRAHGFVGLDANIKASVTSTTGDAVTALSGAGNGNGFAGTGNGSGAGVQGTGGATGPGIKGLGTGTGAGGDFTGGATGPGLVVRGQNTDLPLAEFLDRSGNIRTTVDHNGIRLGRVTEYTENYIGQVAGTYTVGVGLTEIPNTNLWAQANDTNEVLGFPCDVTGMPGPTMQISLTAAIGDWVTVRTFTDPGSTHLFVLASTSTTGVIYTLEFEVSMHGALNNTDHFIGFCHTAGGATLIGAGGQAVGLAKRAADTTWQLATCAAGAVNYANTTVSANTSDQVYKIKLEYHTASSPYGAIARLFIDDVLTTSVTSLPTATMDLMVRSVCQSGVAATTLNVSPFKLAWNRVQAGTKN